MSLHECRVYDDQGRLKQTVQFRQVTEKYWQTFFVEHGEYTRLPGDRTGGKQRTYNIECVFCKNKAEVRRKYAKYCSALCKGRANSKKKKARLDEAAGRRYTLKCKLCEKYWKAVKPNYKYCGDACKAEANLLKSKRFSEKSKANLIKRKLEVAQRKEEVFQREHQATLERSAAGETHPVQGI